jgi:hypothetical protein
MKPVYDSDGNLIGMDVDESEFENIDYIVDETTEELIYVSDRAQEKTRQLTEEILSKFMIGYK